ncbi:MAG: sugar ABC transporter substrate-binding protein [Thermomicrobiales bacterium]
MRFERSLPSISRRGMLGATAGAAISLPFARFNPAFAQTELNVLSPLAPDPAPPGVAEFSLDAFEAWKSENEAAVSYEAVAWSELHDKMATNFASGSYVHDVMYMSGWVPEFSSFLTPLDGYISDELRADLPGSSFSTVTWSGIELGVVFTLSLLTLFYNQAHLDEAGITAPPANWDELKGYAEELTRDGRYGWVLNYGAPEGIGGVASYWMVFLQQAGGKMYGDDGMPVFNDSAGIDALQLMIDLMPFTEPSSIANVGINDATNVLTSGTASMMMNWPFMYRAAEDPETSLIVGQLGTSILPAGEAGSASIDGTDAWTIASNSPNQDLSWDLIEFYLGPEVQKRQVLDTGWLPIRLSVLEDPEVQESSANAAVVLEQAQHPYESFVTPDYNQITQVIGSEIQKALQGSQTAAETMQICSDAVTEIVSAR